MTKPGYADASATVTVEHDKTVPIHFGLVPPTGSLAVTSTPDGARIFLDGLETGEMTNATLVSVPAGGHTVRVERDGYREAEAAVTVTAGGTASCHLDLEKIVVLPVADFSASVTCLTAHRSVHRCIDRRPDCLAWAFRDGTTGPREPDLHLPGLGPTPSAWGHERGWEQQHDEAGLHCRDRATGRPDTGSALDIPAAT